MERGQLAGAQRGVGLGGADWMVRIRNDMLLSPIHSLQTPSHAQIALSIPCTLDLLRKLSPLYPSVPPVRHSCNSQPVGITGMTWL